MWFFSESIVLSNLCVSSNFILGRNECFVNQAKSLCASLDAWCSSCGNSSVYIQTKFLVSVTVLFLPVTWTACHTNLFAGSSFCSFNDTFFSPLIILGASSSFWLFLTLIQKHQNCPKFPSLNPKKKKRERERENTASFLDPSIFLCERTIFYHLLPCFSIFS